MQTYNSSSAAGFSLLELLVSLVLLSMLALGIAHYQAVNKNILLRMQQETLAARALDTLLVEARLNNSTSIQLHNLLASSNCQLSGQTSKDNWCNKVINLPRVEAKTSATSVSLEWQTPFGVANVSRPKLAN